MGGGEPVPTPPPAADDSGTAEADADDEPDDKDDERASLLLVVSRTRRVGEGEEPDSSDKIPVLEKLGIKMVKNSLQKFKNYLSGIV